DVRVVQGLLQIVYSDARSTQRMESESQRLKIKLGPIPTPTGIYDSDLQNWITLFQAYSSSLAQDGRLDPLPGSINFNADTPRGKEYQLFMLNKTAIYVNASQFMDLGPKIGVGYWAKLSGVE